MDLVLLFIKQIKRSSLLHPTNRWNTQQAKRDDAYQQQSKMDEAYQVKPKFLILNCHGFSKNLVICVQSSYLLQEDVICPCMIV